MGVCACRHARNARWNPFSGQIRPNAAANSPLRVRRLRSKSDETPFSNGGSIGNVLGKLSAWDRETQWKKVFGRVTVREAALYQRNARCRVTSTGTSSTGR